LVDSFVSRKEFVVRCEINGKDDEMDMVEIVDPKFAQLSRQRICIGYANVLPA
jgi:hypothetical protein